MKNQKPTLGPLLYARCYLGPGKGHALSVLLAVPLDNDPPVVTGASTCAPGTRVDQMGGLDFWRFDLTMPDRGGSYRVGDQEHLVRLGSPVDDLGMAFVSCNGKEHGDFDRPAEQREAMWARLLAQHKESPFSLLLHGGDQIYADAALDAHLEITRWAGLPPNRRGEVAVVPGMEQAVIDVFFDRWSRSVGAGPAAQLMAEVPSAAMWDDHDIFDGYGSHPAPVQDSPVGQMIYRVARRIFDLFQAGGVPGGPTLTSALSQPGFGVVLPDLRSERQQDRVMGPLGWKATEAAFASFAPGDPLFVVSSVPALGPRLSLIESLHRIVPGAQRYEDDLRDQWQSRAHRDEWRRFLKLAAQRTGNGGPVTFLSGEIHLASRAEMKLPEGGTIHQLTASGISHPPPPKGFARALGALAMLGEAPLSGHPITIKPLPGGLQRYVAERNFLVLRREAGHWRAFWELEESGSTGWLDLPGSVEPTVGSALR